MTPQEYLNRLCDVNSSWRREVDASVYRIVIQGELDDEEELFLEGLNECRNGEEVPLVTLDDLEAFTAHAVKTLTKEWEEVESSGKTDDVDFDQINEALEATDFECYMDFLSERFPRIHSAFVQYNEDNSEG